MMRGAFDWEGQDVVLKWQPKVAVYRTPWGGIAIRQDAEGTAEDDDEVHLTPIGALQLAWRLIEVAHWIGLPQPCQELMVGLDTGPVAPLAANSAAPGEASDGFFVTDVREAA